MTAQNYIYNFTKVYPFFSLLGPTSNTILSVIYFYKIVLMPFSKSVRNFFSKNGFGTFLELVKKMHQKLYFQFFGRFLAQLQLQFSQSFAYVGTLLIPF